MNQTAFGLRWLIPEFVFSPQNNGHLALVITVNKMRKHFGSRAGDTWLKVELAEYCGFLLLTMGVE